MGEKAGFYTTLLDGEEKTEATKFFEIINKKAPRKAENLYSQIEYQTEKRGCLDSLFYYERDENIYKMKDDNWRLYCIRFGKVAVIIGGGGFKDVPKTQDSEMLEGHVNNLQYINMIINQRIKDKEIIVTENGLTGNLKFKTE